MKIKAPKEVAETAEVLDAITPEVKGRGGLKALLLIPVALGAVAVFAQRRLRKDPESKPDRKVTIEFNRPDNKSTPAKDHK